MIETFLKKNWRTICLLTAILFSYLVWPTPYAYWTDKDGDYMRANRFTGQREVYWYNLGEWRGNSPEEWYKADKESAEIKKRFGQNKSTK